MKKVILLSALALGGCAQGVSSNQTLQIAAQVANGALLVACTLTPEGLVIANDIDTSQVGQANNAKWAKVATDACTAYFKAQGKL